MSYIPYEDFQIFCKENWFLIHTFWDIFDIQWTCQTKNLYKRFAAKLEAFKNVIKLISLYKEMSPDEKISALALEELRNSSYHIVKVLIESYHAVEYRVRKSAYPMCSRQLPVCGLGEPDEISRHP